MEKPGPGTSHPEVFVKDEIKSPLRRAVEDAITVVCWAIYLYLLLPMFTLVLWVFGVQTIYDQIIGEQGYAELIRLLENGGITTAVILAILLGWTWYNYLWFKRRGERRGGQVLISPENDIAALLATDLQSMEGIRGARRMEILVDGPLYRVTSREGCEPAGGGESPESRS